MALDTKEPPALGDLAARQLANATKTAAADVGSITPRWLVQLLQWMPVEAGIYRVNRVKDASQRRGRLLRPADERELPADLRRLRGEAARVHAQRGHDGARRAHARLRPLQQPARPDHASSSGSRSRRSRSGRRASSSTTRSTACCTTWRRDAAIKTRTRRADARRSRRAARARCGRSRRSSSRTRAPSRRSAASARAAACRRPRSRCSARSSSPGAACRSSRRDKVRRRRRRQRRPASCCCARARSSRASSACSSRACPGEQSPGLSVRFMGINQQGDRVVPDLALLLAGRADRGRAGRARGRRGRASTMSTSDPSGRGPLDPEILRAHWPARCSAAMPQPARMPAVHVADAAGARAVAPAPARPSASAPRCAPALAIAGSCRRSPTSRSRRTLPRRVRRAASRRRHRVPGDAHLRSLLADCRRACRPDVAGRLRPIPRRRRAVVLFPRARAPAALERSAPSFARRPGRPRSARSAARFDVDADPARLPDPRGAGQRPAAGLARQRGDHAEAAGGDRSPPLLLRARELEHPPRRAHARGARRPTPTRTRARRCGAS